MDMFPHVAKNVFGEDNKVEDEDNLFVLADRMAGHPDRPRIYMGIGTEDFLYADNQPLKERFETLGYDFTYRESPGNHNWEFWDEYIRYVLEWMLK